MIVRTLVWDNGLVTSATGGYIVPTDFNTQTVNTFLAGPSSGGSSTPTFRTINPADIPTLNQSTSGNASTATALATPRTINGVTFDGTANITIFPNVVGSNDLTGQTGAVTLLTVAPPVSLGTYRVSPYLTITAILVDVANIQVTYKDETGASRTQTFSVMGTTSPALGSVGAFTFPPITIRAASGTNIVVSTVLTTSTGTIAYDVGAVIEQLA